MWLSLATDMTDCKSRVVEHEIESSVESRNEQLAQVRELGPPDLVHLIRQSPKSGGRQVRADINTQALTV